ncbi:hypothetical protein CK486_13225 [Pseudomonas sp. HAR-UPW-AIA-41]|uniref:lipase secretion chaperone n=1 Tax=Pseudomonas sp. HAR-UPW-AIA-41 TaxID=1985301 RepID=UPI000BB32E18|nr:lipase secretion chaperone [Pseudomonas sp. HAR-UPW-AIA-41]PAV47504.1 hypothetical protein CK486_13225 [Pseudomonas sp. HAR-UPW-AIA-41]
MSKKFFLNSWAIGFSALGITAVLFFGELNPPSVETQGKPATLVPKDPRSQQATTYNQQLQQTPAAQLDDPGPLPPSLLGSHHGVLLRQNDQGGLVIELAQIKLFEFYLAGLEEEGVDKVLLRIHRELAQQLRGAALTQARDLLRRYVDYRLALQILPRHDHNLDPGTLRQRYEALSGIRQQFFSAEEYQAFFGRDNAQDEYMLQRLALVQQQGLSNLQRQQALNELETQLPEDIRRIRSESTRHGDLYEATQAMQAAGASPEEIRLLREQTLGSEAAQRLAELDKQQAEWQQRLSDYASERDRLRALGLSETDFQNALSELLASRFDELERIRVNALDAEL